MIRTGTILIVSLFLLVNILPVIHADETERAISGIWTERALMLLEMPDNQSSRTEAEKALEIASEFSGDTSDMYYIRALLIKNDPTRTRSLHTAREYSALSLVNPSGRDLVSLEKKSVLYADLSLGTRSYKEYIDFFTELPAGEKNNPILLYVAARSLIYLGLTDQAYSLARRGEVLSTPETDISVLSQEFKGSASMLFRALLLVAGQGKKDITEMFDSDSDPETVLIPWILSGYLDPAILPPDLMELSPVFHELNTLPPEEYRRDLSLLRRLYSASDDNLRRELENWAGNYSGTLIVDSDYDGYAEETVVLQNGILKSMETDRDQDGFHELVISYDSGGDPLEVELNNARTLVAYSRNQYPVVQQIRENRDNQSILVTFGPGAYRWEIGGAQDLWTAPTLPYNFEGQEEEKLWNSARMVTVDSETGTGGSIQAISMLLDGLPLRTIERFYPSKTINDPWVRELLYEEGVPIAGRRSFRNDNDNRQVWEVYERYEQGVLVGLAWDPDMEGLPVYFQDWGLQPYFTVSAWDIDRDGWMDLRRLVLPENTVDERQLFMGEVDIKDLIPWETAEWAPWQYRESNR